MNSSSFCNILRIDIRESRRGNQEWKIQKNCQHWIQNTQDTGQRGATRIPLNSIMLLIASLLQKKTYTQHCVVFNFLLLQTKFCTD
jgi:hypothetical protein